MSGPTGLFAPASLDIEALSNAVRHIAEMAENGWAANDESPRTVHLTRMGFADAPAVLHDLDPLAAALIDVRVVGSRGGATISLRRVGIAYEVDQLPNVGPDQLFDDPVDVERGIRAWERDSGAALALPFEWQVTASVELGQLVDGPPGVEIRAALSAEPVFNAVLSASVVSIGQLLPTTTSRRLYLATSAPAEILHLGSVSFAGLAVGGSDQQEPPPAITLPPVAQPMPGEVPSERTGLAGIPVPSGLLSIETPETAPASWEPVRARCEALAALAVWAMLASDVARDGEQTRLEFLGFKRVSLALPEPATLDQPVVVGALKLRAWVFHDASPDRFLAVRQVVSLYQGAEAVAHPHDVLESAEVVYLGLRTNAVAEALKSTREAQSQTVDTVRQSLRSVQDLAKSAAERLFAVLVAIGAVIVANAGQTLSNRAGRNLLLLVAAFLVSMALSAIFIEGPLLSAPLKNIDGDLRTGAPLLTEDQLQRIVALPSVAATKGKVRILRWIVPGVYLLLAGAILLFGYPSHYR